MLVMEKELSIDLARHHEVPLVVKLLKDAAHWLHARKINQWQFLLAADEDEEIVDWVLSGKTYLARHGGEVVGTFTLYDRQSEWDRQIWGECSDDAVYLHRLASARCGGFRGIGGRLITWAEDESRCRGHAFLRLDCVAGNERLNMYYVDQGFVPIGVCCDHTMYQTSLAAPKDG